jgi:hypothetical protein
MNRQITQVGNAQYLDLTEELKCIGASDIVLVQMVEGPFPQLILSVPPTLEEAIEATVTDYGSALQILDTVPDTHRTEGDEKPDSFIGRDEDVL